MRVALDASFPMATHSGSFRFLAELIRALNEVEDVDDISVDLIVTDAARCALTKYGVDAGNMQHHLIDSTESMTARMSMVRDVIKNLKPSVIHSPTYFSPLITGVRRVITVHDLNFI